MHPISRRTALAGATITLLASSARMGATQQAVMGPLARTPDGREFRRPDGEAVWLCGSHSWTNLVEIANATNQGAAFDFTAYLDLLSAHGMNLIRLWSWEGSLHAGGRLAGPVTPGMHERTGPGTAADGGPRFDLDRFHQPYFDRLRARCQAAQARGIYVAVMLFNGWAVHRKLGEMPDPWPFHPFHPGNNVNGLAPADAATLESDDPAVRHHQHAYIRKVVQSVGDLPNILYEVTNESDAAALPWQRSIIEFLNRHQAERGQMHPVGLTAPWPNPEGLNVAMLRTARLAGAAWISPDLWSDNHMEGDPPDAPEGLVSIADTDHGGSWINADLVWRHVARGHHVIHMDSLTGTGIRGRLKDSSDRQKGDASGRAGMRAVRLAFDLLGGANGMRPLRQLASTTFCLAEPHRAWIVYAPEGGSMTLDLSGVEGEFGASWLAPEGVAPQPAGRLRGGRLASLTAPFAPAVLILRRQRTEAG